MIWPTQEEVEEQLKSASSVVTESVDIRLQVYEDGVWFIRIGDAQYDTDHRGFWGSGTIGPRASLEEIKATAENMLEEAKEQEAL